jgi:hypothetical protein
MFKKLRRQNKMLSPGSDTLMSQYKANIRHHVEFYVQGEYKMQFVTFVKPLKAPNICKALSKHHGTTQKAASGEGPEKA